MRFREEPGPGGAPPLILLHMAGGGSSVWGPVVSLLGRSCRVVAPDFPAHGQSAPSPARAVPTPLPPGVTEGAGVLAGWVIRFMDALGIPKAALAGHSMGGAVAITVALLAPQRVLGLGLVCTAADLRLPKEFLSMLEQRYEEFLGQFGGVAHAPGGGVQPIFPQASREVVLEDFRRVHGFQVTPLLPSITVPTVVVAGGCDLLTPPTAARNLADSIPRAALTVVEGGGHMLPREQPGKVAQTLAVLRERMAW